MDRPLVELFDKGPPSSIGIDKIAQCNTFGACNSKRYFRTVTAPSPHARSVASAFSRYVGQLSA